MVSSGARTGRPAGGDGRNKGRILEASREEFAAKGFRGTTMREIAGRAGVDVALLSHYFGNKDGLFSATMELPERARGILAHALSGPLETQGERLARSYLDLWEDPSTSAQMRVLSRSALTNEAAAVRMRAMLVGNTTSSEASQLLAHRRTGFTLAMAHLLGVAFTRYLTKIPAIANLDFDTLVARTAPAVQLHLTAVD